MPYPDLNGKKYVTFCTNSLGMEIKFAQKEIMSHDYLLW
jgi:hypothetical protein